MSGFPSGSDEAAEHEALIQFLYLAPVGLVQADMDGAITLINPISAQLLMPLSRDGGLDNLFTALQDVAPDLRASCERFAAPSGMVCDGQHLHLHGGQRNTPQILSLSLLKLNGQRLMAVLQDVTLQVQRERQLRQSDAWLNALLASITDYALVSLDGAGRVDQWNASIGRVTGHTQAIVGQPYSVFDPADATTPEGLRDRLREADDSGWSLDEGLRLRADGTPFWGSVLIAPLPERDPQAPDTDPAYSLVLRDITDRREASETWRQAIFSDHLTGVANRRAFFYAVEMELGRAQRFPRPVALVMLDLDHFKRINDTHGHAAGDAVLGAFAQALRGVFRAVDVVARLGGEEFAVLLPSTDVIQASAVVERLRAAIELQGVPWEGTEIRFTFSAGVASWDAQVAGVDALLHRADRAMYAAKAAGRNRIVRWSPDLEDAP
ncbi:PAS domain S-box-containing protein/diguanylate cyclase (GGDEF)-like protein [Pseudoduganella lurida]|uniref:diguanylate cyclase n=1 Tax=Pseudoduganella lurida TaxID=1036180 RepID=A0A562R8J4_9BURK|nr:sensor domain-containing diguanylate cyclase [Pseudoduganella lurida]TWI65381.1 PAS domain S-box-containing protein/diguanylate cyclase (GGDEF)-like protein [Pseudoduganella lurida]